jgi:lipopolysaccharide export LptBFGC system permease protein LptF
VQYVGRALGLLLLLRVVSHAVNISSAAIASHFTTPLAVLVLAVVAAQLLRRQLRPNRLQLAVLACIRLGVPGHHLPSRVQLLRH